MRILILNWKDIKHPLYGGAEIVTHQFALNLVRRGHEVTLLTSHPNNLLRYEVIDGVTIVRRGSLYTVYFHAFFLYFLWFRLWADVVIDEIHGVSFMTPLYIKKPILAWIHETAEHIWLTEFPFLIGYIGKLFENTYFSLYTHTTFLTDTNSTLFDLEKFNIPKQQIHVLPLTIEKIPKIKTKKATRPLLVYIGRLSPVKRLEWLLEAAYQLNKEVPGLQVVIAGSGKLQYEEKLQLIANKFSLSKTVIFLGKIPESKKYQLLKRAWLNIQPSLKEGFGLTVLEAASQHTPTVTFDVGGLRDIIKNRNTGIIVAKETPQALADTLIEIISNERHLSYLSEKAFRWSNTFPSWNTQTQKFEEILKSVVK